MTAKAWRNEVKKAIENYEHSNWLNRIHQHSKLVNYSKWKVQAGFESYLRVPDCAGRRLLLMVRTGSNDLNVDAKRGLCARSERKCEWCTEVIEDETHFMLRCPQHITEHTYKDST